MATYNGAQYLREQIDSILNQTYPVHELIIQDDKSTDNTVAIANEYANRNSVVKVFVNERNMGLNQNFKSAVMRATGDFIALSDQDDIWFKDKLERQVAAIGNCDLLLKDDLLSILRLCRLCQKHRAKIYFYKQTYGLKGWLRGFFFPMIYSCTHFPYMFYKNMLTK